MTKSNTLFIGCGLWVLALATVFAPGAIAQTGNGGASPKASAAEAVSRTTPDMRLWSFGECDNRFPYVQSEEHKECVRVVGSPEARDARAYKVCETSNSRDPAEVTRCKLTYDENKSTATKHGYVPDAPAQPQAPASAEELRRVRAITAAALERNREEAAAAAAAQGEPPAPEPEVPPPEPESGMRTPLLVALLFGAVLLGGATILSRRRQATA